MDQAAFCEFFFSERSLLRLRLMRPAAMRRIGQKFADITRPGLFSFLRAGVLLAFLTKKVVEAEGV